MKRTKLAIVGIGNTIVGDDGAGVEAVRRLMKRWEGERGVDFHLLQGDLYEICSYLDSADEFLFVDAIAGSQVGSVMQHQGEPRAYAPSFHQTDIHSVMCGLRNLQYVQPFPPWQLWGIVISPPCEISTGLSPEASQGIGELVESVSRAVENKLSQLRANTPKQYIQAVAD